MAVTEIIELETDEKYYIHTTIELRVDEEDDDAEE